jgi:hypothetical protein
MWLRRTAANARLRLAFTLPEAREKAATMTIATDVAPTVKEERTIAEKKRLALTYIGDAWDEALGEGVDPDILAHAALFTALADMIAAYGEEAVAEFAEKLPKKIRNFEFSVDVTVQ